MPNVTIYTTPTCGFCAMAKKFFTEHQVAYTEKDVSQHAEAAEEMVAKSGQMGVPVTIVTGDGGKETLIVGFDRPRLAAAVGVRE